jgi:hypothetical protein
MLMQRAPMDAERRCTLTHVASCFNGADELTELQLGECRDALLWLGHRYTTGRSVRKRSRMLTTDTAPAICAV